jgi:hypothetical protein
MTPTSSPLPARVIGEVGIAFLVSVALALAAARDGRLLTFDGYHYVELAKQFSSEWPDRFGNHWPFGWPLAGGLLARLGLPAYYALFLLALLSIGTLLACAASLLGRNPVRLGVLVAISSAPIIAPQIGSCLTELPFATALLGLAVCLVHWPHRAALWGAAGCAVLALGLRYAGLVALAIIAVSILTRWRELRAAVRLREAITAWLAASTVTALLLGLNVLQSGHASGASRGAPAGLSSVYREFPSFGWSAPSALIMGGLRDRIGPDSVAGLVIGSACFALVAALCAWSWFQPRSSASRPLAIVAFGYSSGMCVLHSIGDFDALYNARTFLPALAPLAILAAERLSERRVGLWVFCLLLAAAGAGAAVRGTSRQIGGDVRPAVAALRSRISAGDRILINDHAMSISAYFPQPTDRVWAQIGTDGATRAFIVAAGKPTHRDGSGAILPADWLKLTEQLVRSGRFRFLVQEAGLVALERIGPPASTP